MTPKNIHKIYVPPKIFIMPKTPKNIDIQNFDKKMTQAYVCMNISEYPTPFIKYKRSLYFGSTYTCFNVIYYSIIFLFTDINDVLSQTANCDFWVFKRAGPNTVSLRKGWNLPQAGLNLVALQIFNCDIDARLNILQEHHPYAKGLGSLNELARSSSMIEGGGLVNI